MKTVTSKQFWSKGFIICCFVPLAALVVLQAYIGDYWSAVWQAVVLAILCVNNYLMCSNETLARELHDQLLINIELIEFIKKNIQKEK